MIQLVWLGKKLWIPRIPIPWLQLQCFELHLANGNYCTC
jgi:hypothetical protein